MYWNVFWMNSNCKIKKTILNLFSTCNKENKKGVCAKLKKTVLENSQIVETFLPLILLHTPFPFKRSCMECTVYKWCIINTLPLPNVYARLGGEDKGFNSIVYLKTMRKKLEAFNNPSHHKILPPPPLLLPQPFFLSITSSLPPTSFL